MSNKLLIGIDYSIIRRKLIIKHSIIAVILLTIHIISIVSVAINGLFFYYYVHLIFPVSIIRFRCIQSTFYVDLMKDKLQLLNQKLEAKVSRREFDKLFVLSDKFFYDTLIIMKTIYGKIWDITNLCNDCFGYSFLFIVSLKNINFELLAK